MAMEKKPTALHWFRKNLRLHDNPALCEALKGCDNLFALYILPPFIPDANISANRWNFLIECLEDLDSSLKSLGSQLLVVQGYPAQVIPSLLKNLHVTKLTFERESEPFGKQRDAVITHLAESVGVEVVSCTSHTLYDVDQVTELNGNETPVQFHEFLDVISKIGPPEHPVTTVNHGMLASLLTKGVPFQDQNIPSVEDLGIEKSKVTCKEVWHGGEAEALRKLDSLLKEIVYSDFHSDGGASKLSPYLRFGCLSPRTLYHSLTETYLKVKHQAPPLSLFNSLLQRDFYFTLGSNNPTLHQMQNNPVCLQIKWKDDSMAVEKWKMGKTGFPFIDAIMRQLRLEGWISDIARHVVGSFLTRGCMWLSWEEGFKVFGEMHLDAEWSLDAGSWLSFSGSIFDQQNLTILCPVESGKMIDPTGNYTRKYVPEVRGLPNEYVFEPWKAPQSVQKAAACLVGKDYPLPLADHREQRRVCVQRLKKLAKTIGTSRAVNARGHTSVHLFRKDLRLHDNPTLRSCLEGSGTFYPVYILDTEAARESKISANRWNFLLECLHDLDSQLTRLGSRLFVVRGRDVEVLPRLLSEWGVSRLSFETDSEPFGAQRDAVVRKIAEDAGIEVLSKTSHTLYEPGQILHANQGVVPMLFEDFVRVVEDSEINVPGPVETVDKQLVGSCVTPVGIDHHVKFGVPGLSELGVKDSRLVTSSGLWKGGEQEALRRLSLLEGELVKNDFEEVPLTAASMASSGTHLSPFLRFGCLSPRVMWQRLTETFGKVKGKMPPTSFCQSLLLREFFFLMAASNPGLHKMENNPLSVQFPWEENAEGLERWKQGCTGFPWIDAVMRQLRIEGWIPHVARLAVGCFLTRGCLWINWEEGYKVFDELQLDAEWSLNVGNWLWLSGSTFVKEHIPWFCPVEVGKKIDPSGEYVRKYVPEVSGLPTEYVFEPWKAPKSVQKATACLVGKDYPLPIVDYREQRRVCVQRLKELAEMVGTTRSVEVRGHTSVHLFRKDLRLHDNPSLRSCLEGSGTFYPVYILDTEAARQSKISANRWNFLLECLHDLDSQLRRLGSRLFVVRGKNVEVLPKLLSEWGVSRLSFEIDSEPFGAQRDAVVRKIAEDAGIEVLSKTSHTLYEPGQILHANEGVVPMLFEDFVRVVEDSEINVPGPAEAVDKQLMGSCVTPVGIDHHVKFGVPGLSELGVKDSRLVTSSGLWKGGEQEGLRRLALLEGELVKNDFEEVPLNAASMASSGTHLSPFLRFGCLSPRVMWQRLTETYGKVKGKMPSTSFYQPLLLREFFFLMAASNPGLHKMENNPLSVQFPWEENAEGLERWKQGCTGFPWIDAVMRQLRIEGWIPHVARLAVGCFLTRGCLWINWEEGYKVFDELQLDAEWSLNVGNWLWLSGSTFVKEHIPWFCPVEVGKKIDPSGEYVRKYVPEVSGLPTEYVFEPWKAPESLQKSAACLVGKDYPLPIVDHREQRRVCVQRLKELAEMVGTTRSVAVRGHTSVHLFRKDLRLHDNPSLRSCLEGSGTFYPVYILDTEAARQSKISANRWNFLLECLHDLDSQLRWLGSRLFVVRGRDVEVLPKLLSEWGISRLSFETDSEPFGAQRDAVVRKIAEDAGIEVLSKTSHTLYEPGQILHANEGVVPMLFEDFVRVVEDSEIKVPGPAEPVDKQLMGSCVTPVGIDHHVKFGVPGLSELGVKDSRFVTSSGLWKGGEQEALRRLALLEGELVKNDFEEVPLNAASMASSATHLSPFLRFGCLSPRVMCQRLTEKYGKVKGKMPPTSFYRSLLLREFFFLMAASNPGLHKMENNPLSVQFPWEENAEGLERWKQGCTGFPWIDAVMRQLRIEGWIPHVARLAVGCFLTRGCLWINWEEGYKVFDELQLDAEWSLNVGNWLWLSGSTFVKEHIPWFCPVEVGKKIDPSGEYVRKYVPEVSGLPTEYVFEPWKAPKSVQKAAACLVGKDYPLPIVDHREQRRVCVQRLKELAEMVGTSRSVEVRGHTSVHLFRKDLRLHDNPTLRSCLEGSGTFYPVYILDTEAARQSKISANRWNFLLECLHDLDSQLRRLGSRLFVVRGKDVELLPKLLFEWGVSRLSFETDSEPFGAQRDAVVRKIAEDAGIEVLSKTSHTLYEPGQILHANQGVVPMLFEDFVRVVEDSEINVPGPAEPVDKQLMGSCVTPVGIDHHVKFGVPGLGELGVKDSRLVTSSGLWTGGEQEALRRVSLLEGELVKSDFEEVPLNAASMASSGTHLSPFLRFGCLSPRVMWQRLTETYGKIKGKMPPTSFYQPLLLREFFFLMAANNPNLHKMENNPLSVQFPWEENAEGLERWKQGCTGFPWIDAVMRQLRIEGWIPHVTRLAVGCFLTRGCLWINWEEGYKVFDELQLDAEWSLNVGNWLWLSGSTFVKEHIPWFCPVEVGKKIDPSGEYVRKYVPEVSGLPTEYVFEPWKAPKSVQKAAACLVGKDYPLPIVDHREQRRVCVQRLKELAEIVGTSRSVEVRGHTSVHLFRKDLRLHDNPTLRSCLEGSGTFYPVYILDTEAARQSKISANRWNFLLECLHDLDSQLRRLGSRLFVVRGRDVEVLPKLLSQWGVSRLSFETDSEPFGAQRDAVVQKIAEDAGIEVLSKTSHTLYEPGQILHASQGVVPMLYEDFVRVVEDSELTVPIPVGDVGKQAMGGFVTPVAIDHQAEFGVPELNELGMKDSRLVTCTGVWKGGEQEALKRVFILEGALKKNDFEKIPLNSGSILSSGTHLSPYLRFGCLSPRVLWHFFTEAYEKAKGKSPPTSFYQPLLLREFFFLMAASNPNLHKMENNPLSVQFPWEENPEGLRRWKLGTTGFPWIDAVMRQLRIEGWIPHVARLAVGCFLTRGCLWINWEEGYKVFDELQLDAEWSLNVVNWLWLSGSTFVKEHIPWLCPVEVGKKIDPSGEYVRKYVPEVRRLPLKYLFEPWKAPMGVQKRARCIVGEDYPEPVVDHIEQRRICVERLNDMCISLDISGHKSLHWFRKDLRLHDNPSLRGCLANSKVFYGVYVLECSSEGRMNVSPNRWEFLLQSLRDLDNSLVQLGSRLFVIKGRPVDILPSLFKEWDITRLSFEPDCEPDCKARDMVITNLAQQAGIEVINRVSHTLYDPETLLMSAGGRVPLQIDAFKELVLLQGRPEMPVATVDRKQFGSCTTPVGEDHNKRFGVPTLEEIVLHKPLTVSSRLYGGGEREALLRLDKALQQMVINDFCEPHLTASSLMPSEIHLSPYLRLGCLSPRLFYQRITQEYIKAKTSNPPQKMFNKLLWREFFFTVGSQLPESPEMVNNPLSLQIPWEESAEYLERWKQGMTGFPWIDAIMRQLRSEGWIHDVARRAVGSFLTRGCLWINWEEGFKVFDEFQLDAERSLNSGNWLWLSGSTYVREHIPWLCPVEVGKKIDPTGEYVRRYVPEVRNLPTEYVFEPWLAPRDLQMSCCCVIGQDYPSPIVDHVQQRAICVQRLRDLAFSLTAADKFI